MKVAVINFSGNVGKTTVAAHLLKPRMNDAPIYSVETLNVDASADGVAVEQIRGRKFGELREQLMSVEDAIVDIGASNVEDFLHLMKQYSGSHEEFDLFVVPVVKERKQQMDTVRTIMALSNIGIPREKLRVVFNKLPTDEKPQEEFEEIFGLARLQDSFRASPDAVVHLNEVFDLMKEAGLSLAAITADTTDYRAKLKETTDLKERSRCVRMTSLKMLSKSANKNLDAAYAALMTD